jgi:hypothetical protein
MPYELPQLHCCVEEIDTLEEVPHEVRTTLEPLTSRQYKPLPRAPFKLMIGTAGTGLAPQYADVVPIQPLLLQQ